MKTVRSSDGTAIAYDCSGDGPPVVLVAGAFGDRSAKRDLAALLSPKYTVYQYDRRGRGDSGGSSASSVAQEIDDLSAVLSVAGEAVIFGDSSGGALAIETAAAGAPNRGLAVYEVPYTAGPSLEFAHRLDELVAAGRPRDAVSEFLSLMGTPAEAIAQMQAGPYWSHLESLAATLSADIRLCNHGAVPADRLSSIQTPLLSLAGGASPWAAGVAQAVAAAAAHGAVRILEGQGHAVADDVLATALEDFIR